MVKLSMKKAYYALIGLLSLVLMLGGCALQRQYMPVTNSNDRTVFMGFSVLPPGGVGWKWVGSAEQDKGSLSKTNFFKKDGDRTYAAIALMIDAREGARACSTCWEWSSDLPKLIVQLKASGRFQEAPRQTGMKLDMKIDRTLTTPCVRYDLESEDPGVPGRPGMIFDFDLHGFVCPHPETSGFFAMIEYSRRHPKGQPPIAGRNEGEQFLESLEIMAVHP